MTGKIVGTGSYLPEVVWDNHKLTEWLDTNDEWIKERTGIHERHIAEGVEPSGMALEAAKRAMEDAKKVGLAVEELDAIFVCSVTPDISVPPIACFVQKELGAVNAFCYDLNAACSGFVFAYNMAVSYMETGLIKNALIIGSEKLSNMVNWEDRGSCILFGDGAGAVIVTACEEKGASVMHSDGASGEALQCTTGGKLSMDGQKVFRFALKRVPEVVEELLGKLAPKDSEKRLLGDLIEKGDVVVLVTPIDESAPKGRLILPQQLAIRDILDADATVVVTKETGLEKTLKDLAKPPKMVITDSQVFGYVQKIVPEDVPLTSFSILMARYKGYLETAVRGVRAIADLKDGDTVLMAEGCTHHRQCNDIGTVKIPNWLRKFTGKDIKIETSSGFGFPEDLSKYAVVIHCGGCMLNEREVRYRTKCAVDQGVPITNYGTLIAYLNGILKRSVELFPELYQELNA